MTDNIKSIEKNPQKYAKQLTNDELVSLLITFSDAYYNTGNSLVSDATYDALVDILKERSPSNPCKDIGRPW